MLGSNIVQDLWGRFWWWLTQQSGLSVVANLTLVGVTLWYVRLTSRLVQTNEFVVNLNRKRFLMATVPRLVIAISVVNPDERRIKWEIRNKASDSSGDIRVSKIELRWRTFDGEQMLVFPSYEGSILLYGGSLGYECAIDSRQWHPKMSEHFPDVVKQVFVLTVFCADMLGFVEYEYSWGWRTAYRVRVVKENESLKYEPVVLPRQQGLTDPLDDRRSDGTADRSH